ncbi:MAG: hypothetical protein NTY77_06340 [Elusimicrobia bacterium]|nr:hypothetical protein [Elusimicrobiota bacterium]
MKKSSMALAMGVCVMAVLLLSGCPTNQKRNTKQAESNTLNDDAVIKFSSSDGEHWHIESMKSEEKNKPIPIPNK